MYNWNVAGNEDPRRGLDCDHRHGFPWAPPPRCTDCGHRVPTQSNMRPVETRRLPVRLWLAELLMRGVARYIGRHPSDVNWFQEKRHDGPTA
jgi:hypothetical protein